MIRTLKELGPRIVAERLGEKISKRRERMGVAMGISGDQSFY
jgi:hypothetical protein